MVSVIQRSDVRETDSGPGTEITVTKENNRLRLNNKTMNYLM